MGSGHPKTGKLLGLLDRRACGYGQRQPAMAKPELGEDLGLTAVLGEQILSGDPEIDHIVGHELGYVLGPNEEKIEFYVAHPDRERAVGLLENQPGVPQQRGGRLLEPSLVGYG